MPFLNVWVADDDLPEDEEKEVLEEAIDAALEALERGDVEQAKLLLEDPWQVMRVLDERERKARLYEEWKQAKQLETK